MTIRVVADTHTILWYFYNHPRLSITASTLLDVTDAAGDHIAISSIVLAEVVYLIKKGRINPMAFDRILAALSRVDATLIEIPSIALSYKRCGVSTARTFPNCQIGL